MSFEPRRDREMTTEYLGRVLEQYLGFNEMASRARQGHFDDYFCPPEVDDGMNIHRLVRELSIRSESLAVDAPLRQRIESVRNAAIHGEFDGTTEESNRWAASKEGRGILSQLANKTRFSEG